MLQLFMSLSVFFQKGSRTSTIFPDLLEQMTFLFKFYRRFLRLEIVGKCEACSAARCRRNERPPIT